MSQESTSHTDNQEAEPQESVWLNLIMNIAIPSLIMMKGSSEDYLGPTWGLIVALCFPLGYGIYDFFRTSKVNWFSVIGIISVLLTGGISLLKLPPEYMAIKEAAIPGILGMAVLISAFTQYPLVKVLLFNKKMIQVDKVNHELSSRSNESAFEKVLLHASYMLAGSFFLSSVLNYGLAKWILVSPPGTEAYTAELGKMTALSYPVIVIPSMIIMMTALFYLMNRVTKLTGLSLEDMMVEQTSKKKS